MKCTIHMISYFAMFRLTIPTVTVVLFVGCSKHDLGTLPLVPVAGKISVEGEPLDRGYIQFIPAGARQAQHQYHSTAEIRADGFYSLKTRTAEGAPEGNYLVVVAATATPMPDPSKRSGWVPDWIIHEKYTQKKTTDLKATVVASPTPGAYDFDLLR